MPVGERAARTGFWWLWEIPAITDALRRARSLHLGAVIRHKLHGRLKEGRFPGTQEELAEAIRRTRATVGRILNGGQSVTDQTLLGLTVALDCSSADFLLVPHDWIAQTTQILCDNRVLKHEALCYTLYRLS